MPDNLDFAALIPEHHTFTDADGARHEFRARVDFGAVDLARINRMQKDVQAALDMLSLKPEDEASAQQVETLTGGFITLILPSLPVERVGAMTLGQKSRIVEWWTNRETLAGKNGNSPGEAPATQPSASSPG